MKYKIFVNIFLSCFIFFTNVSAQWKDISKRFPANVKVFSITHNNYAIFAGTNDGVYKSIDEGLSWQGINRKEFHSLIPKDAQHLELICLSARGDTLFAGTNGLGVFIFDGYKWHLSTDGLEDETVSGDKPIPEAITYDQRNVYFGSKNGRIYILSDGDSSWNKSRIISSGINSLLVKGDSILVGGSCSSHGIRQGCCLFLSTNQGNNWNNFDSTLGCQIIYSLVTQNGTIYIGTGGEESAIIKSIDNGKSWIRLVSNSEYPFHNVQSIIVRGDKVFAATIGGLLFSNDGGTHWVFIQHPTKKHKAFNLKSIFIAKTEIIAISPFELWSYPISSLIH